MIKLKDLLLKENIDYETAEDFVSRKQEQMEDLGAWYGENVVKMVNRIAHTNLHSSASDRTIRRTLEQLGYDGVVYQNRFEGDDDSYIAFNPQQLKIINKITL